MKTADQMFHELGYERILIPSLLECIIGYTKPDGSEEILFREDGIIEFLSNDETCGALPDEILACAQLIQEMEAEK